MRHGRLDRSGPRSQVEGINAMNGYRAGRGAEAAREAYRREIRLFEDHLGDFSLGYV